MMVSNKLNNNSLTLNEQLLTDLDHDNFQNQDLMKVTTSIQSQFQ